MPPMLKIVENEAVKEEGYTLDALAREGARRMLRGALEEEVAAYVERHAEARDGEGRRLVTQRASAGRGASRVVPAHWKCGPLGSTTGGWAKKESGAGSRAGSCRPTCAARRRSRRSCRFCICGDFRRGTSARRSRVCSGRRRRARRRRT